MKTNLLKAAEIGNDECEFCEELVQPGQSRFARIYGSSTHGRLLAASAGFVAMPTLGQLFTHSLLVLPVAHVETLATLGTRRLSDLAEFVQRLLPAVRNFGNPVLFEHGARCVTGGGCGIYHAHLHIAPVPGPILCDDVFPSHAHESETFFDALGLLSDAAQYLIFSDTTGHTKYLGPEEVKEGMFPSQYFRQALVRHFGLDKPWDWREYEDHEKPLLETIAYFRTHHVLVSA